MALLIPLICQHLQSQECHHLAGARAARIDRRAHNPAHALIRARTKRNVQGTKEMLTRLLRRPLGLWRAQASLSLLDVFAPPPPTLESVVLDVVAPSPSASSARAS